MLTFLIWWIFLLVLGMGFLPLTSLLFHNYNDRGWLYSKVIALAISGFITWVLVCIGIAPFTAVTCIIVTVACIFLNVVLQRFLLKKGINHLIFPKQQWKLIIAEEVIFFVVFLLWTYLAGFHPAAYGTEKFMDYGFMASMMRSKTLPAEDLWYAGSKMNYYYGGQYYAVFFTKLTGTRVAETYNVMRTLVAAFAFSLPFSLVYQLWTDRMKMVRKGKPVFAVLAALLSGAAVSLCGNMHYVIMGKLYPLAQQMSLVPKSDYTYWFPNSTRYLGHYPELSDRTIHEFPCYSFVLGDLHAHVVNIMYVLTVVGILYAWIKTDQQQRANASWKDILREALSPYALILGFFIGIFQWTNFWDFLIYFVITCAAVLYRMILKYRQKWLLIIGRSVLQCAVIGIIAVIAALPFTLQFDSMVNGVALAQNHSILYQWLVLWGLPFTLCIMFIVWLVMYFIRNTGKKIDKCNVFQYIDRYDMFVIILSLCAMGLVVLTEVVYVKDIYEATSARANTMFKLTYEAFIIFGICMPYILFRFLSTETTKKLRKLGVAGIICLVATLGYFGTSIKAWFPEFWDVKKYQGVDATAFLEEEFSEDAAAIRWLNENISGMPVVLEANGDSYTDNERVSAMTGLPTVLGWYVHEWLWRNDTDQLNIRSADIEKIYTSENPDEVRTLLEQYQVVYIFVGSQEREKYETLNDEVVRSMGEIAFESDGAYIVEVSK